MKDNGTVTRTRPGDEDNQRLIHLQDRGVMKRFFSIAVVLLLAASFGAVAQVAVPSAGNAVKTQPIPLASGGLLAPAPAMPAMPAPETIGMMYANNQTGSLLFRVPSIYTASSTTTLKSLNVSQRFTLPVVEGFIDSIYIFIAELPLGKVRIDAWQDAMRKNPSAPDTNVLYHYPDYWGTTAAPILDSAKVSSYQVNTQGFTKVNFNHVLLPKEFHMTVMPYPDSGIQPLVGLVSDSRLGSSDTLNPTDARTTMLFLVTSGTTTYTIPIFLQGLFQNQTGNPLAPNWYIATFLEVDMAAGGTQTVVVSSTPTLAQNAPNPFRMANGITEIRFDLAQRGFTTLDVYDAMGRTVRTLASEELDAGSHLRVFHAGSLPAGTYYYRLVSGGRQITRSMLYVR
jgi:hypothetical protein